MSRHLFAVGLLSALLFGAGSNSPNGDWTFEDTFALKKDQRQYIEIHAKQKTHRLTFRWTLYQNGGLVMLVKYDGHRYQPLLYADYKRDGFRIDLFSKPNDASPMQFVTPHALLLFKRFDEKKREAWIDVKIKADEKTEVLYTKGR
ncbi:hypothetical protein [Hydrogenimonas sp. SS33]|uniref:hypothetical protein n=1 Tax=Hydrogenimonas leucolamina TaxID=2954236 RepID=UPI00336BB14D